jgi:1-acyl-sn-glycerol-3-phosphate acyltransferase
VYRFVRSLGGLALDVFYRRRVMGAPFPASGPVLVVANHPNGLLDPADVMQLTHRRVRFLAKAPLVEAPVFGGVLRSMGTLPVYRRMDGADTAQNERTFRAVFDALRAGEVVCLFPEGTSHSEPALQQLKTGAARMVLGAQAESATAQRVAILAVGLLHARKGRFRSPMAAWVGEPVYADDLAGLHAKDERAAVHELTERISQALKRVLVELDDWGDLAVLDLAESIWPRNDAERVERLRELSVSLRRLRAEDPERADELVRRVTELGDRLACLGLRVRDLDLRYTAGGVARFAARNAFLFAVSLPLALVGALFWWLPYRLVGWIAGMRRVSADIVATQKVLAGLAVFGLWYAGAIVLASTLGDAWDALVVAGGAPGLGVLTLRFADRLAAGRKEVTTFLRFRGAASLKERLAARRDELLRDLGEVYSRLRTSPSDAPRSSVSTGGE